MGAAQYTYVGSKDMYLPSGIVIEIGAERGEGSTEWLRAWCNSHARTFLSVDIEPKLPGTLQMSGEKFLELLRPDVTIAFAYLDNYDYVFPHIRGEGWVDEQIQGYKDKHNIVMTNEESQRVHWRQAREVNKRSVWGSVIVIDDTYLDNGVPSGKGGFAVMALTESGRWSLVEPLQEDPQSAAILRRN